MASEPSSSRDVGNLMSTTSNASIRATSNRPSLGRHPMYSLPVGSLSSDSARDPTRITRTQITRTQAGSRPRSDWMIGPLSYVGCRPGRPHPSIYGCLVQTSAAGSSIAQEAVFRPVRSGNAFEEAVERILQAIKLGVVTYGERLPAERELARRLAVSRVTL